MRDLMNFLSRPGSGRDGLFLQTNYFEIKPFLYPLKTFKKLWFSDVSDTEMEHCPEMS